MPRQIKDEYEIIEEIGAGGMAIVHKALQKSLNRPVAIKELKKGYHADHQIVRRFERESIVAASLQHENIVHIYDYWKKPNYCIVMEYVDGTNLAEIIEKAGGLPVDISIMIAMQVCSALDYAHMRGLIHRDIKPSNIMVKRNGEVKLMDFGIAHTRNLEALTIPGTVVGTPAYMSPEQIVGQNLDIRSDVFSFGIVLYEMLTGTKPFVDEDTRAVSAKILKDKFVPPRRINSDIPRSVQRIVKKCLNKKPQKRFGSMLDIEKKLGKRLAGKTTKAASLLRITEYLVSQKVIEPATDQETLIITGSLPRRGWLRQAAAAVLLLSAVSGAGFYYLRTKSEVPVTVPATEPASAASQPLLVTQPEPTTSVSPVSSVNSNENLLKSSGSASPATDTLASSQTPTLSLSRAASIKHKKEQPSQAQKKKNTLKKKKKTASSH